MRKHIALAAAVTITVAGCSSAPHTPALPGTTTSNAEITSRIDRIRQQALDGKIVFAAYLKPVGDCDALLAHLHTEAGARVGPYGLPGIGYGGGYATATGAIGRASATDSAGAKTATAAPPLTQSAPATSTASAPGFSGTNNQEAAVDEPDIIKTDGKRIVTLNGNKLSVVNVDGGTAGAVRTTAIGETTFAPTELLMVGDHALVFGTRAVGYGGPVPMAGVRSMPIDTIYSPYNGTGAATITEVDLSGTGAPKVGSTLRVDGAYLTARLVGSTVRMVLRSEPQQLDFVTPQNKNGEARARKANEDVILESKIDAWLPSYELLDNTGKITAKGLLTDCANVDAPTEFAGFGSLSVLTFDATKPLTNANAVSILAGGKTVYASDANLYVATETWIDPAAQDDRVASWERDYTTSIHEFSIGGSAPAHYVASGTVPGFLLNQFSMSEYKGVLRAASTKGVPWSNRNTSESFITTLKQSGDKLTQLGQVGNMGRGERLYSVRFADDAAYVVTFRQTDPFYTVNLTDPAKPSVVGELKINGYSGYLHPIGDNLVLGVGQDATSTGRVQGAKVSLFDVSDLANPKELAKWAVPNAQTGVEWDHHAFLWWPATKTLVFPLMEYANSTQFYGAVVLHVDRATGITEQGRVAHGTEKPANLGATDCRKLTQDELNRAGMNYFVAGEQLMLSCGKGQVGGAIGYQCSTIDPQQFVGPPNAGPTTTIAVAAGGHVEVCSTSWNQPTPIQRSVVIGSSLWTLSPQHLQANALDTLTRTARLDL